MPQAVTALSTLNIATEAPIPSVRNATSSAVNRGCRGQSRAALQHSGCERLEAAHRAPSISTWWASRAASGFGEREGTPLGSNERDHDVRNPHQRDSRVTRRAQRVVPDLVGQDASDDAADDAVAH